MRAGLYARVSTERQADRGTIGSQLALLREHIAAAGDELVGEYVDDGQSGADWTAPAWTRCVMPPRPGSWNESGACRRTGSPRLRLPGAGARRAGPLRGQRRTTDSPGLAADDPQATLLTQVQGVIAEYEKAKIAERYRRGKLFRARAGEIVIWKASYGYRRIPRSTATGQAHHEVYEPRPRGPADLHRPRAASQCARSADASTLTQHRHRPANPSGGTPRSAGCCATRPTSAGSTTTAPSRCPTGAPPAQPAGPARSGRMDPDRLHPDHLR